MKWMLWNDCILIFLYKYFNRPSQMGWVHLKEYLCTNNISVTYPLQLRWTSPMDSHRTRGISVTYHCKCDDPLDKWLSALDCGCHYCDGLLKVSDFVIVIVVCYNYYNMAMNSSPYLLPNCDGFEHDNCDGWTCCHNLRWKKSDSYLMGSNSWYCLLGNGWLLQLWWPFIAIQVQI